MGIQDRDYYRDDEPTWWATAAHSKVTYALVLLVATVFVVQVLGSDPRRRIDDALLSASLFDSAAILRGEVWRAVTSHFVHRREALVAVALTAWALYYFGNRVEARYGSVEYGAFLVTAVLTISAAKLLIGVLTGYEVGVPTYGSLPLLGCVLVLSVAVSPPTQLIFGLNVPTVVLAVVAFGLSLSVEVEGGSASPGVVAFPVGVAWALLYYKLDPRLAQRLRLDRLFGPARPSRLKVFRAPAEARPDRAAATDQAARELLSTPTQAAPNNASLDEQLEAKLDQVLAKVSLTGKDSLTGDEQSILRRASEVYKRRRGN